MTDVIAPHSTATVITRHLKCPRFSFLFPDFEERPAETNRKRKNGDTGGGEEGGRRR